MSAPIATADPQSAMKDWIQGLGTAEQPAPPADTPQEQPKEAPNGTPDTQQPPDDVTVGKPAAPAAGKPTPDTTPKPPEPPSPADDAQDKWPRSAQEWKKFREQKAKDLHDRDERIKALETERDEIQKRATSQGPNPEVESLKKERDELSERLRIVDVEKHPRFTAYFKDKVETQLTLAKQVVGAELADKAAKLLAMPDSEYKTAQIEELMTNLGPYQQTQLGTIAVTLAQIEAERQSEIARSRENFSKVQAEQAAATESKRKALEKSFNDLAIKAQEGNPIFQKRDGDTEWNRAVEKRLESARTLFFGAKDAKVEDVIQSTLNAAAYPAVLQSLEDMYKENETLKAQVAALTKATPAVTGTQPASEGAPQPVPVRQGMRPQDATNAWVRSLQES